MTKAEAVMDAWTVSVTSRTINDRNYFLIVNKTDDIATVAFDGKWFSVRAGQQMLVGPVRFSCNVDLL